MSKAIRWQVPFASISGTKYRVDIYDEQDGTWSGITQLLAGETPFVTEEDSSEDFFAPIRTQTGTLQVCTALPDGSRISLDELLPANNIARPVRLINLDNSNAIEWQGFLSCEAYSQAYTEIQENLSLPVISVLEAMDSVFVNPEHIEGLMPVFLILFYLIADFGSANGKIYFERINYSQYSRNIFFKAIYTNLFYKKNEYTTAYSTFYDTSGISIKDVFEMLAKYMGWVVREQGTTLYLQLIGEGDYASRCCTMSQLLNFNSTYNQHIYLPITYGDLTNMIWMGTGHKRNIMQGAKSVSISCKLKEWELKISIPECPINDLIGMYNRLWLNGNYNWLYLLANNNRTAYNNIHTEMYAAEHSLSIDSTLGRYQSNYKESSYIHYIFNLDLLLKMSSTGTVSPAKQSADAPETYHEFYAGAFLCKYAWEQSGDVSNPNTVDALYCMFFPSSLPLSSSSEYWETNFDKSKVGPIFSIDSVIGYTCNNGYIKFYAKCDTVLLDAPSTYKRNLIHTDMLHNLYMNEDWKFEAELSIGDMWWNGTSWQDSQCTFSIRMHNFEVIGNWNSSMAIEETDGLLIPVNEYLSGVVTFKIWPMISYTTKDTWKEAVEMIFTELTVEHILPESNLISDRSENKYFQLLNTNFRDEISIEVDIASYMSNKPSPSIIMRTSDLTMQDLEYIMQDSSIEYKRPENDLISRLVSYYGAARQRLELEVAHPTSAPIPLLKLNGINDGKVYLPLSESRDWRTDECTLTCFETSEVPSES